VVIIQVHYISYLAIHLSINYNFKILDNICQTHAENYRVEHGKVFQFCVYVHHIMINKNTSLMQLISIYFTYRKSLHVSGRTLPIIRRI